MIKKYLLTIVVLSYSFIHIHVVLANENDVTHFWIASKEGGIYAATLNTKTGTVENLRAVQQGMNTSYIVKHPGLDVLYALSNSQSESKLTSYLIQKNGDLLLQSEMDKRPGGGAHINISEDGKFLAAAYYNAGFAGVYNLAQDGSIQSIFDEALHTGSSVNPDRQTTPHPHWVGFGHTSQFLYVPDLGTDHIWIHELDKKKNKLRLLQKAEAPKGAGPRHLAFHPKLKLAYVSNELKSSVSRYAYNPDNGKLKYIDSTVSAKEASKEFWHSVSDIRVHPSGKFLYLVNRGFDQVSVFSINTETGELTPVEREPVRGSISRNIAFDKSGRWALVAGQASNTLAIFDIDLASGELRFTRQVFSVPAPMAIVLK